MNGNITRRTCLAGMGTAGAALLSPSAAPALTAVKRFERAEFAYRFRTFAPGEPVRLGMIGTDGHTEMITGGLASLPDVRLAAWANHTGAAVPAPAVKRYETWEEMLDREELHLVGICLPYYLNAKAAIAAARKGLHIVMEKPVATTLADLDELRSAVTSSRVRLTALLGMRLDPPYQAIRDRITAGDIGDPVLATAQKSYQFGKSRPDFYRDRDTYGGTIPWVGIHAIDYIHYTTRLDYSRVAAFQGNKCHPDYPGVEDQVGVLFEMRNGGTAVLNLDFLRPESAPTHGDDRLRVVGSRGVIELKDGGKRVELIDSTGARDVPLPEPKPFFADFMKELRGQGRHVLAPEEPFEMTRVALLARDAADKGMIVEL